MVTVKIGSFSNSLHAFVEASEKEYGSDAEISQLKHIRWKHQLSPNGESEIIELIDIEKHPELGLGRIAIQARKWISNGEPNDIKLPVDLLISADARGPMQFLSLWRNTVTHCSKSGSFWFHTSNPVSENFYGKVFKYSALTELKPHIIPIRPYKLIESTLFRKSLRFMAFVDSFFHLIFGLINYVLNFVSRIDVEPLKNEDLFDEEIGVLFQKHHLNEIESGQKNASYFTWRYNLHSNREYVIFKVSNRNNSNLVSLIAIRIIKVKGLDGAFVMDVIGKAPSLITRASIWSSVAKILYAESASSCLIFLCNDLNPNLRKWSQFPWIPVPDTFMPQSVPVYFHGVKKGEESLRQCHLTLADFDMF
jgi:hypothetical protein